MAGQVGMLYGRFHVCGRLATCSPFLVAHGLLGEKSKKFYKESPDSCHVKAEDRCQVCHLLGD